ncbi:KR domain-containing protein [Nonomuraea sp. NPDC050310]|uniref:KR domain-containing protein n=1 Tax=Nonomuraea sp. NPDC050310 TaxID=3154935 RepID=UPI0033E94CE4
MSAPMPNPTVHRYTWECAPAPPLPGHPSEDLAGRLVTVLGGLDETADRVSAELAAAGARLWRLGDPGVPDAVVDLTLADPFDLADPTAWEKPLLRTLAVLRHCYDDWAAEPDCHRLGYLAVTYLGGTMGYGEPSGGLGDIVGYGEPSGGLGGPVVYQPLGGVWAGLAKTLHRELPTLNARIVDVAHPRQPDLPTLVARELYRWGLCEVGYHQGRRMTLVPRRRPTPPPATELGPDDIVLVCGGGVGLGYALATELAERYGCEVVVTGRRPLPAGDEDWLTLDEPGFTAYRHDRLRQAAADGSLRETRTHLARLSQRRDLHHNLRTAADRGLRIRYLPCDLTDQAAVDALLDDLSPRRPPVGSPQAELEGDPGVRLDAVVGGPGRRLAGVVYLAGVDRPARLPAKSDRDLLAGVAVKVTGLLRLLAGVRERDLDFLCAAGSLTGRLGGMTGELDYAAGNEALARLGLWAGQTASAGPSFRALTVCWPLWLDLSVSGNVDAALRYMSALDPAEGLDLWCRELVAGAGEVTFLGRLGQALRPVQAAQFVVEHELPGFDVACPRLFHLGEPLVFRPQERLSCRVRFDAAAVPALGDFLVGGRAALPASLLLENALRSAEWLVPEQGPPLLPDELRGVEVDLAGLVAQDGALILDREAEVTELDGRWAVSVIFRRPEDGSAVASMTVTTATGHGPAVPAGRGAPAAAAPAGGREDGEPAAGPGSAVPAAGRGPAVAGGGREGGESAAGPGLEWRGLVIPGARWRDEGEGRVAEVPPCWPADLWVADLPPRHRLPVAAVEAVIRAVTGSRTGRLRIARLTCPAEAVPAPADGTPGGVVVSRGGRGWRGVDPGDGRTVMELDVHEGPDGAGGSR